MPDPLKMMFVRPRNCHYCGHGYHGLYHAVQHAQQLGWDIIDLSAEQANKDPIYAAIDEHDPGSFYGFGHGSVCRYTGDGEQDIFTCEECDKLSGRVVYLLSCLTANGLGPAIIENGGVNYAGFDISWTWISGSGTEGDPYEDIYAKGFWESANELWIAYTEGYNFYVSIQKSIDKYNEWIDYWLYENPNDPGAQDCIMWLVHDRDGLVGLPQLICEEYTTQEECEEVGCQWYGDGCHPAFNGGKGINWAMAIPIILIIGIAYIAVKK